MSPESFLERVRSLADEIGFDPEAFHARTDELMEDTLRSLGYGEGIDAIIKEDRWYA